MVFCPEAKKGYGKMVYVPNPIRSVLPDNLMKIMHLEGVGRSNGLP